MVAHHNSDDTRLLVHAELHVVLNLVDQAVFAPRQDIGIVLPVAAGSGNGLFLLLRQQIAHPLEHVVPPRMLLHLLQVVVVVGVDFAVGAHHLEIEELRHEAIIGHQVGIEHGRDGIRRLHVRQVKAERGGNRAESSTRHRVLHLWCQSHVGVVVTGEADDVETRQHKRGGQRNEEQPFPFLDFLVQLSQVDDVLIFVFFHLCLLFMVVISDELAEHRAFAAVEACQPYQLQGDKWRGNHHRDEAQHGVRDGQVQ